MGFFIGKDTMKENHLLRYGLKGKNFVSIDVVQKGLQCDCKCPNCGTKLVAKKGKNNKHHFAHYNCADCNHGAESALHLLAKSILEQRKELFLPDYRRNKTGRIVRFTDVDLESRDYDGFVPDVVLRKKDHALCVEILVTHSVDEEKRKKIENSKVSTLEVDLSYLIDNYDEAAVVEALNTGKNSYWIYNNKYENELCDHIPFVNSFIGINCYCPSAKRDVSYMFDCSGCRNNEDEFSNDILYCHYREKKLLEQPVTKTKNAVRQDGMILSVEVEIDGVWQHWCGGIDSFLSRDNCCVKNESAELKSNPIFSINGKRISELWNSEFTSMIVKRRTDSKVMLINGTNGEMNKRRVNGSYYVVGKYSNYYDKESPKYSEKYYIVNQAEQPIWDLIWVKKRKED